MKYLLCESLETNFQLLILGYCHKFSTLVSKCPLSTEEANKKAVFSMAWMKMLGNFQVGKATRAIDNRTFPRWTAIGATSVFRSGGCSFKCYPRNGLQHNL